MSDSAAAANTAGTDTTSTTDTTTSATTTSTASNEPWFNSLDPETKNWTDSKGWSDPDMSKVMPKVLSSYRNAEQLISKIKGDPNQILVMPKDGSNPEEVAAFREKLGVPRDIKEYGLDLENPNMKAYAELVHAEGVPKAAAEKIVKWAHDIGEQKLAADEKVFQETSKAEMDEWRREQGATFEQKTQAAKAAIAAFPELKESMGDLEKSMGTKKFMQFMSSIGSKIGEAGAAGNGGGSNTGMTPAAAKQAIQTMYADSNKTAALMDESHPGHAAAKAELQRYNQYIHG